jgi:hypothetical protein
MSPASAYHRARQDPGEPPVPATMSTPRWRIWILPSRNPNPENQPLPRHSAVAAHAKLHEVKQGFRAGWGLGFEPRLAASESAVLQQGYIRV